MRKLFQHCLVVLSLVLLAATASANPSCGSTGSFTLTGNLACNPSGSGAAIYLGSGDVLDCAGYTVSNTTTTGAGVRVTGSGAEIKNCTITKFASGVTVTAGSSVDFHDGQILNSGSTGIGLQTGSSIENSTIAFVNGTGVLAPSGGTYVLDGVWIKNSAGFGINVGSTASLTLTDISSGATMKVENSGSWDVYLNGADGQFLDTCIGKLNLSNAAYVVTTSPTCSPSNLFKSTDSTYIVQ
jgi:hypothetical protein